MKSKEVKRFLRQTNWKKVKKETYVFRDFFYISDFSKFGDIKTTLLFIGLYKKEFPRHVAGISLLDIEELGSGITHAMYRLANRLDSLEKILTLEQIEKWEECEKRHSQKIEKHFDRKRFLKNLCEKLKKCLPHFHIFSKF